MYIIFSVALHTKAPSKFAPLAIGLAVLVDHLVGVPFTGIFSLTSCNYNPNLIIGASMNPARTLAAAVVSQSNFNHIYVYFIGPPLGAIVAGLLYQHGVIHNISGMRGRDSLVKGFLRFFSSFSHKL